MNIWEPLPLDKGYQERQEVNKLYKSSIFQRIISMFNRCADYTVWCGFSQNDIESSKLNRRICFYTDIGNRHVGTRIPIYDYKEVFQWNFPEKYKHLEPSPNIPANSIVVREGDASLIPSFCKEKYEDIK